jgi:leucine dehydrogenase
MGREPEETDVDELFEALQRAGARHTVLWTDAESGLRAVLVIDDVTLGPAAGGVRTQPYPSVHDAVADAARLARAMTLKCALSGLDAGGGKLVVMDHAGLDRERAFAQLGRRVDDLGGLFRTGPDLGTTREELQTMAKESQHVHAEDGVFSDAVARGLLRCIEACAAEHGAAGVAGLRIAVQGCGSIGAAAARALGSAGAKLQVADVNADRARKVADETGAEVVDPEAVLEADVDIVAPCAVGGVLTVPRAEKLRAWAVCGAANNMLSEERVAQILFDRKVLHVPDFIASAGAVIEGIGRTAMGLDDTSPLIDGLGATAREVLQASASSSRTTTEVAEERARKRIDAARAARRPGA